MKKLLPGMSRHKKIASQAIHPSTNRLKQTGTYISALCATPTEAAHG